MNSIKENIILITEEIAEKYGYFLIDILIRGDNRKKIIEIFLDAEKNINAEDLANINREIGSLIDNSSILTGSYRLDVSSPGVDRPLKLLKQFPKHINRSFEVTYSDKNEIKKIIGKLLSVEREELTFLSDGKSILIEFKDIITAKVIVSFS